MSSEERERRIKALQERLCSAPVVEADSAETLLRQVRTYLRAAVNEEVLTNSPQEVFQLVKHGSPRNKTEFLIVGGDKNDERDVNLPCFRRADGGWFHFSLTGRQKTRTAVELLGYNFEYCCPGSPASYVRFDLSSPVGEATANIDRGLRSHMHPGRDDIQIPAAELTWQELLDLCVYRLAPRSIAHRRK